MMSEKYPPDEYFHECNTDNIKAALERNWKMEDFGKKMNYGFTVSKFIPNTPPPPLG